MRQTMKQLRSGRNRIIKKKLEILKKALKIKRGDLHRKFGADQWKGDFHFLRKAMKVANTSDEAYLRTAVRFWKLLNAII